MTGFVYFIQPVIGGPIKIGFSRSPQTRLRSLMCWSAFELRLRATTPGDYALEQRLQVYFAEAHSHLEWFHPTKELEALVSGLETGLALDDLIDLSNVQMKPGANPGLQRTDDNRLLHSYAGRLFHARKAAGEGNAYAVALPRDVDQILSAWSTKYGEGKRPTAEQFARLDQVIADPAAHIAPIAEQGAAQ